MFNTSSIQLNLPSLVKRSRLYRSFFGISLITFSTPDVLRQARINMIALLESEASRTEGNTANLTRPHDSGLSIYPGDKNFLQKFKKIKIYYLAEGQDHCEDC